LVVVLKARLSANRVFFSTLLYQAFVIYALVAPRGMLLVQATSQNMDQGVFTLLASILVYYKMLYATISLNLNVLAQKI
jgi:hypothetical protein